MSNSYSNKKLLIDLSKSIVPSTSSSIKYNQTKPAYLHRTTSASTSPNSNSSCSASSILFTSSSSSSSNSKLKCSPTPSLTSNCSSAISAHTITNTESCSHKSCCSPSCDCTQSHNNLSSSSSSLYSCHEDYEETKREQNKLKNSSSIFSTSHSSDSLNTNNSNSTCFKRTTRNTSRAVKLSNCLFSPETKTNPTEEIETENLDSETKDRKKCEWIKCKYTSDCLTSTEDLIEHVKSKHILTQKDAKKFRCLWRGCNVYGNQSCSFIWLERHVIDHIDSRPFLCIFNGCNRKFRTEQDREKHVQSHINSTGASSTSSPSPVKTRQQKQQMLNSAKIALIQNIKNKTNNQIDNQIKMETNGNNVANGQNGMSKIQNYSQLLKALTKKRKNQTNSDANKKKFKKAQFKDYFDACSLKVIDDRLNKLNYKSGTITFSANIIGSNINNSTGEETFLVEWHPRNIIEDEWLEKSKLTLTKQVNVNELFRNKTNSGLRITDNNPFYRRHRFRANKRK